MEKQKRWQLFLILSVIVLTLYNILPTLFYYSKPLRAPIDAPRAEQVASEISQRVNSLESEAIAWIHSFNKLIGVKAKSVALRPEDPRLVDVVFDNAKDLERFQKILPHAGSRIPFLPAQLDLYAGEAGATPTAAPTATPTATIVRQMGVHLEPTPTLFSYIPKYNKDGALSSEYKSLVADRVETLALALGGQSPMARQIASLTANFEGAQQDTSDLVLMIADEIIALEKAVQKAPELGKRVWNTLLLGPTPSAQLTQLFYAKASAAQTRLEASKDLAAEKNKAALNQAVQILKRHEEAFAATPQALTAVGVRQALDGAPLDGGQEGQTILSLKGTNPLIQSLVIDYADDEITFVFFEDIQKLKSQEAKSEESAFVKEQLNQLLYNEIARVGREADESITPNEEGFSIRLSDLPDTTSFLALNLGEVAQKQSDSLVQQLSSSWRPENPDLVAEAYPVRSWKTYQNESSGDKKLGLVVFSPSMSGEKAPQGFRKSSIYVIARGLSLIQEKVASSGSKPLMQALQRDLNQLKTILTQNGFIGYPGASYGFDKEFAKDYIFELDDYYSSLLRATREDFQVKGLKKQAILPFTDVEQRILVRNKIEDRIQEDLLKWRDEYHAAQVSLDPSARYLVPAPTQNPYWNNFKISFAKFFRGDDRKILKWGLDLSGGKVVRIGLRDKNGQTVTNADDIKQSVNELYTRINKMGVSERTIRVENSNIVLEFPGSQAMSATDLVKASQMTFHIVNEKFSSKDSPYKASVNQFLQEVWNEAVVTNRKTQEEINEIAWKHLGGTAVGLMESRPVSEAAKNLIDAGLVFANPHDKDISGAFNDQISSLGIIRGDDFAEWGGNTHPLLFLFKNYALEGSNLTNIQAGYDPSKGNLLTFNVKRAYEGKNAPSGSPRDDFYTWTSQFSEEKIAGTPKETYTRGRGWRMAVVLNGHIITMPTLQQAIKDSASISGHFSQREVNQLVADLKGGSLSFTPRILSEQNISAELGAEERSKGISASLIALALVAIAMIGYYRFAGLVATVAVLFNILVMWGVLQNLDAALTLPGIAGIVLTIGMAVDANVLVFERIREEFAVTGRIASAIQAGYRKAFSAIFDSNITTIMAALILIQFDSGPIKGFAVSLVIGIFSSMFTALFMTRYFFAGWVQNPAHKELKMSQWIHGTAIDFLAKAKPAIVISLVAMLLGGALFYKERNTIFGMDFTGGYSLNIEVEAKPQVENYRALGLAALQQSGAGATDIDIRQLTLPNQLRISLSQKMEEAGHPFYGLPERINEGAFAYEYQKNPRIDWVVKSLQTHGLAISDYTLQNLDSNWSVVSGQLSDAMRNNALIGLGIALLSILIYITFRFEFKYAVGAVVALIHDVIITLGILAFFNWLGLPVQIDLQVVGAIMTIIGYSLNDTIIVFDRIREDLKILRRLSFYDAVNHALNVTLSRTLMTSGTTLLVLFALVLLGGSSIFAFSLVMTIGVFVGTLSSLFIASPVMLWLHDREEKVLKLKST